MSNSLRNDVQRFGIAHVVAISGFHLTIIFGFLYALLSPIYRFFQGRYFPYRNARWDISLVIFGILGWYLWLIDLTPSFLRAYLMGVVGFLFLWRGIKLLSFQTLALTAALIIALFPHLMFNIGFILSCAGVFFIFVFIRHFGRTLPLWADALLLNFWLFFAMLPLAHYWFGITSWMQFVSIPISILFVVFYPLAAFLHLIGWGGAMDGALMWMLAQPSAVWDVRTSAPMLGAYLLLALAAARWRAGFVPILALSLWYFAAV
jgi:competence protein ComEC